MSPDEKQELTGVGGWLAFFVVIMAVLSPLRILFDMVSVQSAPDLELVFGEALPTVMAVEWLISAVQIGICWFIAWRLVNVHNRKTVRIVIGGLWILTLGILVLELIAVAILAGLPIGAMLSGGAVDIGRAIAFAVIWTAYFRLSKRVANTYLRGDGDEMAKVFS